MSSTSAAPTPRPLASRLGGARLPLASLGVALGGSALTRVHTLTAGTVPSPSHLVAAGLLLGIATGRPSQEIASRRSAALLAGGMIVLVMLGGPVALSHATGWIAGFLSLGGAMAIGWLTRRAGLVSLDVPALLPVACGLGLAGLTLPLAGPLPVGLAGALLVALAGLLRVPSDVVGAEDSTQDSAPRRALAWENLLLAFLGLGSALGLVALMLLLRGQISGPWPFGFLLAGALVAGLALGRRAGSAAPPITLIAILIGIVGMALALRGTLATAAAAVVGTLELNPLTGSGAALALIASALLLGLATTIAPGVVIAGALDSALVVGAAVGLAAAGLASSAFHDPLALLSASVSLLAVTSLPSLHRARGQNHVRSGLGLLAAIAVSLLLVTASWWRESPAGQGSSPRSGSGWTARVTGPDGGPHALEIDGQVVATSDPTREPSGRLAGHLAGLLPGEAHHALVVGWPLPGLLEALSTHGFESITVADPVPGAADAFRSLADAPGRSVNGITWITASSPAALPPGPPYDAIILSLPDPRFRHGEAFFTPSALAALVARLSPDAEFVEIIDLDRLTPPDLFAHVALLRESLPDPVVFLADGGRGGIVLLAAPSPARSAGLSVAATESAESPTPAQVAARPDSRTPGDAAPLEPSRIRDEKLIPPVLVAPRGRPFNLARLLDPQRITPAVEASLRAALLLTPAHLMSTVVAGGTEIDELGENATAWDPWAPGPQGLTLPPPAAIARPLAQALFHDRLRIVDLPVTPGVLQGRGEYSRALPFIGIETHLGPEWALTGELRYQNRIATFLGSSGIYRDHSRQVTFTGPGEEIRVSERPLHSVDLEVLQNSLDGLASGRPMHRGSAMLNGHPTLWAFEQRSPDEQIITATWHCPVSDRLFGLRYRLTEGVKPSLFEKPLERALGSVRCAHGPAALGDVSWRPLPTNVTAPAAAADPTGG